MQSLSPDEPEFSFADHSHRRFNPLTDSWVLCSPHRAKRPWLGQVEEADDSLRPEHDPACFLCPGNERATGQRNDQYTSTYVFPNDYAAVHAEQPDCTSDALARVAGAHASSELFCVDSVRGRCSVVCFSPRHDLSIPELSTSGVAQIIRAWQQVYADHSADPAIAYVQVFENKGAAMGCSNPHPHAQVWALSAVPTEPASEIRALAAYRQRHAACMLCAYVEAELASAAAGDQSNRIVALNESFVALVPFWATWPFETMIVARSHVASITDLQEPHITRLAETMQTLTCRYDNLFRCSFPYSMGLHQAPTATHPDAALCHFHMHFYPPLLRSATVRKFLVGFEMMAEPQRDLTAEQAASRLRAQPSTHHKHSPSA
ncbi:galactose-1-phosphate uridyl transferase [Coemansia thaxteri]|uniref:Galactose-1-phosphate uridylyltransferase n=1 Tax=Coemansia thaxteri TaxID=2663907 RepID=A0A9W8BCL9_9FUNG|nr:galactose-1-phosphate uridyl transferase [Coemansia thaxteri]